MRETLTYINQLAVVLIVIGITHLALSRRPTSLIDLRALSFAIATGAPIAGYTIVDGLSARVAGSPHVYVAWVSLLTPSVIVACTPCLQQGRQAPIGWRTRNAGIAAEVMSYGSSWVVIWAPTLAPFALVSALRKTGVVFAALIGDVMLKERLSLSRLASIARTLIGITLLELGR